MARKRKRNESSDRHARPQKARKTSDTKHAGHGVHQGHIHHAVLAAFYPRVLSLRDFLIERLPKSSRVRRRRIASFGRDSTPSPFARHLWDTTLVGILQDPPPLVTEQRRKNFSAFRQPQKQARVGPESAADGSPTCHIAEV